MLGNAWHLPVSSELRGRGGMLDPVGDIVPGTTVTVINGNQFAGQGGSPGDQFRDGSVVLARKAGTSDWIPHQMEFLRQAGNNKYFGALLRVPANDFEAGDVVEYYLRIAYGDHDLTFLHADTTTTSATSADEKTARVNPFTFTLASAAEKGCWGPTFPLPNVAIHTSVLPTGRILVWGRRDEPGGSLDDHFCTPFLWDPSPADPTDDELETGRLIGETDRPTGPGGVGTVNLFCAGHAFLPDGRLLVVGGHQEDSVGLDQATIYDPEGGSPGTDRGTWTPIRRMRQGRWYPTAMTLPDGSVLVVSGSFREGDGGITNVSEIWKDDTWIPINPLPEGRSFELYPRLHVRTDGSVFMSGPLAQSWRLDLPAGGTWTPASVRDGARRDYAPSVTYDTDKIVFIGGGTSVQDYRPNSDVEAIQLAGQNPQWHDAASMSVARRQHNATMLPDGTVLVTGGTRGGGGPGNPPGFNDLDAGQPVHAAELWDPQTDSWTVLAAEEVDRCYHSTAVLLPDGRVLSAGGGEYRPIPGRGRPPNDTLDSHRDAQIFWPPYLFRGDRPIITKAPTSVEYGESFTIETPTPEAITKVTWIRLPSVTHSIDMSQRIDVLPHLATAGVLTVTAPASPQECPPGYHMLFILNAAGVPSRAVMMRVSEPEGVDFGVPTATPGASIVEDTRVPLPAGATRVVVGVTGTCPYGIGACWGGADEAMRRLTGVQGVDPSPDAETSTVVVHLDHDGFPAVDRWPAQFERSANGSYVWHGAEVEISGTVHVEKGDHILMTGEARPPVRLIPLGPYSKIQWDFTSGTPERLTDTEAAAFATLADGAIVTITGPLTKTGALYELAVRMVESRTRASD